MHKPPTTLEEKRKRLQQVLEQKRQAMASRVAGVSEPAVATPGDWSPANSTDYTLDQFVQSDGSGLDEMHRFHDWVTAVRRQRQYTFEATHLQAQHPRTSIRRETGETLDVLNFSSYNYLGYSYHPDVIAAAKDALDRYGLGAAGSPVSNGTLALHQELETGLLDFFGLEGYGVSLFSSGYGTNTGTISAFVKPGQHIILDSLAHASLHEGAHLAQAQIHSFRHNDMNHLEQILRRISPQSRRILICTEGVYSADGDFGNLRDTVALARRYGAYVLVDEAHSILVAGAQGRGVAEIQEVLAQIDLFILTFSKAFGGIGGALLARKEITRYINWYARCRMFSCALDPAVTGGMRKALELASGSEGHVRRQRLAQNARLLRELLRGQVNIGPSESWVIPVIYGAERLTLPLSDYLQRAGLDTSIMQYPAVPQNQARLRLFVTSEHTPAQIAQAAGLIRDAAQRFGFG